MPDILHDFYIDAPRKRVFEAVTTPAGLDQWWTKRSSGQVAKGAVFELGFGPGYDWRGTVTKFVPDSQFELKISKADRDWNGSLVGFQLKEKDGATTVRFYHKKWPSINEHYRISTYCWAMYLRILKRYVEHGETVPYERRLDV